MGRMFGILVIVFGTWVGIELYMNGTQQALGGALSFLGDSTPGEARKSNPQRAGERTAKAMRAGEERRERMMPD